MKAPLAIFDLDGTLVDLHAVIDFDAMLVETIQGCGGTVPSKADRERFWREGKHHGMWLEARGIHDPGAFWARFDALDMAARASAIRDGRVTLFPDVPGAIDRLRQAGAMLAVLTNAPIELARLELRAFQLDAFDVVLGLGVDGHDQFTAKPEPDGITHVQRLAAARTGREFTRATVMIGDSDIDMLAARSAGVPAILVARREPPGKRPPGTSLVVPSLDDVNASVVRAVIDRFHG